MGSDEGLTPRDLFFPPFRGSQTDRLLASALEVVLAINGALETKMSLCFACFGNGLSFEILRYVSVALGDFL